MSLLRLGGRLFTLRSARLVDNDPASASAGKDLQLEKALEVLAARIKEQPFTLPPRPVIPIK